MHVCLADFFTSSSAAYNTITHLNWLNQVSHSSGDKKALSPHESRDSPRLLSVAMQVGSLLATLWPVMVGFDNFFASYRYSRFGEDSLYIDIVYLWFVAVERRRPIKFIEVPCIVRFSVWWLDWNTYITICDRILENLFLGTSKLLQKLNWNFYNLVLNIFLYIWIMQLLNLAVNFHTKSFLSPRRYEWLHQTG